MKKTKLLMLISIWVISFLSICTSAVVVVLMLGIFLNPLDGYADEYKNYLPNSATEISERMIDIHPDWSYYLKAKISQEDFNKITNTVKLIKSNRESMDRIPKYDSTIIIKDNFQREQLKQYENMQWWDSMNTDDIYYVENNPRLTATYENGYLYFQAIKY